MAKRSRPFRYKTYGEGFPLVIIPGLDGITEFHADNIPEFSRHFKVVVYYLVQRQVYFPFSDNYNSRFSCS